jgi:hypothetical protein
MFEVKNAFRVSSLECRPPTPEACASAEASAARGRRTMVSGSGRLNINFKTSRLLFCNNFKLNVGDLCHGSAFGFRLPYYTDNNDHRP